MSRRETRSELLLEANRSVSSAALGPGAIGGMIADGVKSVSRGHVIDDNLMIPPSQPCCSLSDWNSPQSFAVVRYRSMAQNRNTAITHTTF